MTEEKKESKIDVRIQSMEALNIVQAHKINILTSRLALVEMGLKALGQKINLKENEEND